MLMKVLFGFVIISYFILFQEFQGEECTDLYLEERELQLRSAQEEKRRLQMSVPGIINPHDMPEEMQD